MCLDILWTKKETAKWLKNKPDFITAFKVVEIGYLVGCSVEKAYPLFHDKMGGFCKINRIEQESSPTRVNSRMSYTPHFHACITKTAAEYWATGWRARRIFKCKIPKSKITAIGEQGGYITIITKEFTFVEGERFFTEKDN